MKTLILSCMLAASLSAHATDLTDAQLKAFLVKHSTEQTCKGHGYWATGIGKPFCVPHDTSGPISNDERIANIEFDVQEIKYKLGM